MIYISQLKDALEALELAHKAARRDFSDPLYIAYVVDFIFDGKAPAKEVQNKYPEIMKARKNAAFRHFWTKYKEAKAAMSNFETVNMGVICWMKRGDYIRKFRREHPNQVPF